MPKYCAICGNEIFPAISTDEELLIPPFGTEYDTLYAQLQTFDYRKKLRLINQYFCEEHIESLQALIEQLKINTRIFGEEPE